MHIGYSIVVVTLVARGEGQLVYSLDGALFAVVGAEAALAVTVCLVASIAGLALAGVQGVVASRSTVVYVVLANSLMEGSPS